MAFEKELIGGRWHLVDREREIVFKTVMSGREGDYVFEIAVRGRPVRFEAMNDSRRYMLAAAEKKYMEDVVWKIFKINIPDDMRGQALEIKQFIEEALSAKGVNLNQESVHSMTINFAPGLFERFIN